MSEQIIYGASNATFAPSTNVGSAFPFGARGYGLTNHFQRALLPAADGLIKNLRVTQTAAPGGAGSVLHKISDDTDPGLGSDECGLFIGPAETAGESGDSFVRVTKGVPLFYSVRTSTGSAASTFVHWSFVFVPDTPGETLLAGTGGTATLGVANTQYLSFAGAEVIFSTTLANEDAVSPIAGTLKALHVDTSETLGAGETRTFTLFKNGIATGIVVALTEGDDDGSDLVNSVVVAQSDTFVLQCIPTGSPNAATCKIGLVFVADDNDRFLCLTSSDANMPNNRTRYSFIHDGDIQWNGNQTLRDCLASVGTSRAKFVRMRVNLSGNPGFGNSYEFTLMRNGVATGLSATISGVATGAIVGANIPIADDDLFSTRMVPTSLPNLRTAKITYACETLPATVHIRGGELLGGEITSIV